MFKSKIAQSDYITTLLSEVEKFRTSLSAVSAEKISLEEALHLWVERGYGRRFRRNYSESKHKLNEAHA